MFAFIIILVLVFLFIFFQLGIIGSITKVVLWIIAFPFMLLWSIIKVIGHIISKGFTIFAIMCLIFIIIMLFHYGVF